jgi:hypothetical protein
MTNLNSKTEFFEGKKFDYTVHRRMPKIKVNPRKRRKTAFKGIINNEHNGKATTSRGD